MEQTKKYFTISEQGNKKTCFKLEAYYNKGGWNCVCGNVEKRGIWVSFTKVERMTYTDSNYTVESVMAFADTNFKVFVKELSRKNDKKLAEYWQKVERNGELLFGLWNDGEYTAAANFVCGLVD